MNTSALRRLEHPKSKSIPPLYDLQYVSQPSYSVDSTINMHTTPVEKNVGVSENGEKTGYFIGIMMTDQWISGHPPWNCHRWVPGRHQPGVSRSRLWTFLPTWEQRWRRTRQAVSTTPQVLHWELFFAYGKSQKMEISENRGTSGTPKSSMLIGFSIIHQPFWGTYGNSQMAVFSGLAGLDFCWLPICRGEVVERWSQNGMHSRLKMTISCQKWYTFQRENAFSLILQIGCWSLASCISWSTGRTGINHS